MTSIHLPSLPHTPSNKRGPCGIEGGLQHYHGHGHSIGPSTLGLRLSFNIGQEKGARKGGEENITIVAVLVFIPLFHPGPRMKQARARAICELSTRVIFSS
ncbi:hypothetical protein GOP47_0000414 [Adiantum capillus-veneris]|uniref:Uncharacterized protein n=1 Tax=Adiantum capillus-veneris TaxID=13818 RepID=A0A9D4VDX1_ADICA|nr:hypothetical protein GOP47_0000414 [Adiantum capillus-veneris]